VTLCVDSSDPPYAFVLIGDDRATTDENPDECGASRRAARYVGEEKAEEHGRLNACEVMMLVRGVLIRVVTENNITGE
jgi:hypothetical protein